MATESFESMADCTWNLEWYQFDNDSKKYLLSIIQLAQQPLTYEGYIILTLNLETFTQVMRIYAESDRKQMMTKISIF